MRRIVASLCASLLAVGLLAGPVLAGGSTGGFFTISSLAKAELTANEVWACDNGSYATAYIEANLFVAHLQMDPIGSGRPTPRVETEISYVRVEGCGTDQFRAIPSLSGDLTGQFEPDAMAIELWDWAVLDIGPVVQYDRGHNLTGASATFDLEWQVTGQPVKSSPTYDGNPVPYLGVLRSAPADVAGTVTVTGLPSSWHPGWSGSITFEANEDAEASLHWMAMRVLPQ